MTDKKAPLSSADKNRRLTTSLLAAIFITGAFLTCWTAKRTDYEMRENLLQQTQVTAQAIDLQHVFALSHTPKDLDSPDYQRLKEQLSAVRSANPLCRFLYLMDRKANGAIFFIADSEPVSSKDYSPPGQIYEEASNGTRRVFETGAATVEGPITDRWGTWVSAMVPLVDPRTGALIAVLGMDIDARDWKWDLAAKAALPIGLMLVLLIGVAAAFLSARRIEISPKPVLRRLLPPLAAVVILLTTGAEILLWQQQQQRLAASITANTSDVSHDFRIALGQQAAGLATALQTITAEPETQKALREGDADHLLATWQPVFETLHRGNYLTHLYFSDKNRVCLLRVHKPEKRGDRIDRFTTLEAERTGKIASGIELGPLGTFTLRVVQPVFADGSLVGYTELGKEIEDVLLEIHHRSNDQLAVIIRKEFLDQQAWEEGMRLLEREAVWNRLPQSVLVYSSQSYLPDAIAIWIHQLASHHVPSETGLEVPFKGKNWWISGIPLRDASNKEVGDLIVFHNIAPEKAASGRPIILGGTVGVVLIALLLL